MMINRPVINHPVINRPIRPVIKRPVIKRPRTQNLSVLCAHFQYLAEAKNPKLRH